MVLLWSGMERAEPMYSCRESDEQCRVSAVRYLIHVLGSLSHGRLLLLTL